MAGRRYRLPGLSTVALHRGKRVPLSYPLGKRPKQVRHTVRIVADERAVGWKYREPIPRSHQHPPHLEHPPRPIEGLLDAAFMPDDPGVQLVKHVAQLAHSCHQLVSPDEIRVEALNGRACERHRRDRYDRANLLHHGIREHLNALEPLRTLEGKQAPSTGVAVLLRYPVAERQRLADNDRGAPISFPPPCHQTGKIPPHVSDDLSELDVE